MTSLLAPLAPVDGQPASDAKAPTGRVDLAAGVALAVALVVWAVPVTHGTGGRDPWVLGLGLLSVVPALLLVRPWRVLPTWQVSVAMAPAVAALIVCLTAPTGFDGLDETATLAYCGGLYVATRSWAVDALRRRLLMVMLALVGLEQFTQAYLPWWGGGSVRTMMVGTFYWHNQYAAFVLGTGLVAGVLAVRGSGLVRRVGWLTAPWCLASLLFAGSRASLATFVVAWTVVLVLSFLDRKGRIAALSLVAVSLGLAAFLTSPLLMDDAGWFTSTVQARESSQSVEGNGRGRIELWRAAVGLGSDHPVTGAGFDSFGSAGATRMPAGYTLSTYVHNGYLQAFSDGGLVLLLPLTVATGLALALGLRLLLRRRREDDLVAVAVPVALLALILHAGVDFDWAYPSLAALFALLAALLPTRDVSLRRTRRAGPAVCLLGLTLVVVAVPAAVRSSALRAPGADVPPWAAAVGTVVPLHGTLDWLPAASVCRDELSAPQRYTREHGLRCTARAAQDDPSLALLRAQTQARNGQVATGIRAADAVIAEHGQRRPMLRIAYAGVVREAGRVDDARDELEDLHDLLVSQGRGADAETVEDLVEQMTAPSAG
jgi:O-antigen ligase